MPLRFAVAVLGTGVIGRSWIRVFAGAADLEVRCFDAAPARVDEAVRWCEEELDRDQLAGLVTSGQAASTRSRIVKCRDLATAVAGVDYVQESGPEEIVSKREIFAALDSASDPSVILASSTSA